MWLRGKKVPSEDVFLNLDDVVNKPVVIHVFGQDHEIKPLNMVEFAIAVNAVKNIQKLAESKTITEEDIQEKYQELFQSMCPTLTKKITKKLTQPQSIRLFHVMFRVITGEFYSTGEDDGKKKLLMNQTSP